MENPKVQRLMRIRIMVKLARLKKLKARQIPEKKLNPRNPISEASTGQEQMTTKR